MNRSHFYAIFFGPLCALPVVSCGSNTPTDSGVTDVAVMDVPNADSGFCSMPAPAVDSNRDGKVSCLELQDFFANERPRQDDARLGCLFCDSPLDTCSTPACDQPAAAVIEFSVRCNGARRWELQRYNVCAVPDVPNPPPRDVPNGEGGGEGGTGPGDGGDGGSVMDTGMSGG
jgi:hypothetical protein